MAQKLWLKYTLLHFYKEYKKQLFFFIKKNKQHNDKLSKDHKFINSEFPFKVIL